MNLVSTAALALAMSTDAFAAAVGKGATLHKPQFREALRTAMAVGVSLAFLNVNIIATAAAIGLATLTMVTLGVMLGRVLGVLAGKRTEIVGGLLLVGIGSYILFEHLSGAG